MASVKKKNSNNTDYTRKAKSSFIPNTFLMRFSVVY